MEKYKKEQIKEIVVRRVLKNFPNMNVEIEGFEKGCIMTPFETITKAIDLTIHLMDKSMEEIKNG